MKRWLVMALVLLWSASLWAAPPAIPPQHSEFPSVVLTRNTEQPYSVEILTVTCTSDRSGNDEFVCQVSRKRNGYEIASVALRASVVKSMLKDFFQTMPKGARPPASVKGKGDPALFEWKVEFKSQRSQGSISRKETAVEGSFATVKALLALEAMLDAQLIR